MKKMFPPVVIKFHHCSYYPDKITIKSILQYGSFATVSAHQSQNPICHEIKKKPLHKTPEMALNFVATIVVN
jgi:hypothetical protein